MGRWTRSFLMLFVCGPLLACATTHASLANDTPARSTLSRPQFYSVPLQPHSREALLRLLDAKQRTGDLGSFALDGTRLLIRQLKECCSEVEILYAPGFDHAEALLAVPNNASDQMYLLTADLLEARRERFRGAIGNGFLYVAMGAGEFDTRITPNQYVVLNVSPTDNASPRVLKTAWIQRSPDEIADQLGLLSPKNELRKIQALTRAGRLAEASALHDRDAWLFNLADADVKSPYHLLADQVRPKPPPDDTETLLVALEQGGVFERLQALERARSRLSPANMERTTGSVHRLLLDVSDEAERAEKQGRLATAAHLLRTRVALEPKADISHAQELDTRLRASCEPKIRLTGALASEPPPESVPSSPSVIEVESTTPVVKLAPKFTREEKTSTYKGAVKLTERFSGESQRRLFEIAARQKEIEDERAKSPETAASFNKEVTDLNDEKTKLLDASATSRELGDLLYHYIATTQTWTAAVTMSAVTADGETVEVTARYQGTPRVRVTADPEHNVRGLNEWVDEATARTAAIAYGRAALLEKVREQIVRNRYRQCLAAGAEKVEGTEADRRREKELRLAK